MLNPNAINRLLVGILLLNSLLLEGDVIADRTGVEKVYYGHRTGTTLPFEEVLPREQIQKLVELDLKKERILRQVYGISLGEEQVQAEVNRINRTTRAPEVLAEIKFALGDDPDRFAQIVARPIVVDRVLRSQFANDPELHQSKRKALERIRDGLLDRKAQGIGGQSRFLDEGDQTTVEVTWLLGPKPEQDNGPQPVTLNPQPIMGTAKSGSYSVDSTVELAQVLNSPEEPSPEDNPQFYFQDLEPRLRRALQAQLRTPGDVSAVFEFPDRFQLFLLISVDPEKITVSSITIPKASYTNWVREQNL